VAEQARYFGGVVSTNASVPRPARWSASEAFQIWKVNPVHFAAAQSQYSNDTCSIADHRHEWMRWIPDATSLAALSLPMVSAV
jgi:hypothetical protein